MTLPVDVDQNAGGLTVIGRKCRMRVYSRCRATVLAIDGDIDATNGDCVQYFAARSIRAGKALAVDLSGVEFFAARGISELITIDDACRVAEVPWALVPSRVVRRVLGFVACDTALPITSSVPDAVRQLTTLAQSPRGRAHEHRAVGHQDVRKAATS